jgi:hypothetical protein
MGAGGTTRRRRFCMIRGTSPGATSTLTLLTETSTGRLSCHSSPTDPAPPDVATPTTYELDVLSTQSHARIPGHSAVPRRSVPTLSGSRPSAVANPVGYDICFIRRCSSNGLRDTMPNIVAGRALSYPDTLNTPPRERFQADGGAKLGCKSMPGPSRRARRAQGLARRPGVSGSSSTVAIAAQTLAVRSLPQVGDRLHHVPEVLTRSPEIVDAHG